jgi:D-alanine-D-alanine ligase-like ATP-grasp enzyme
VATGLELEAAVAAGAAVGSAVAGLGSGIVEEFEASAELQFGSSVAEEHFQKVTAGLETPFVVVASAEVASAETASAEAESQSAGFEEDTP